MVDPLQVVHEADQLPLAVHLDRAAQGEMFEDHDIQLPEHRLHRAHPTGVDHPAEGRIDLLLHLLVEVCFALLICEGGAAS